MKINTPKYLIAIFLGKRIKTVGFAYADIFASHLAGFFNGGDCVEDVKVKTCIL